MELLGQAKPSPPLKKSAVSTEWRVEQWMPEEFTGTLGGGPAFGPAVESGSGAGYLCGDRHGNIYLLNGNTIDIITTKGVKHRLAGTGVPGSRDGPANQAQFDQGGDYNVPRSIQCDDRGNIFTAENGSGRVRRVFKNKAGKWMVDTVAGGGKRWLRDGETCAPTDVNLGANIAVAASPDGTLTIGGGDAGFLRISADGTRVLKLGGWPAPCGDTRILVNADGDHKGNAYFIQRGPPAHTIVRVSPKGEISLMMGPKGVGDAPPLETSINTPTSVAANPDGSCVYACGGDEYDIRRVPTDLKSTTATLLCNGRWHVFQGVDPRSNAAAAKANNCVFNPKLTDKPPNFLNCHILGRDYEGNLYGSLYPWCGATQFVEGKGELRTALYRIRRVR